MATATAYEPLAVLSIIRVSASSDIKEYNGKHHGDYHARSWSAKLKTACFRDQVLDSEKCINFWRLLTDPAQNWYRHLSWTARGNWIQLLQDLQVQFYGLGVSGAWQYYHTRKRSNESTLGYLYRLNVVRIRAQLNIKDVHPREAWTCGTLRENIGWSRISESAHLTQDVRSNELEHVLRSR